MKRARPLLEVAIQQEEWEVAALCLLLGLVRAARKISPETLEEMIELLSQAPRRERAERSPREGDKRHYPARRERFYDKVLSQAELLMLEEARGLEGLNEEIAMLRVRLVTALRDHPDDLRLLTHGISILVRAVAAQYRLSPKARRDLAGHLTNLLKSLGDQLLPATT